MQSLMAKIIELQLRKMQMKMGQLEALERIQEVESQQV